MGIQNVPTQIIPVAVTANDIKNIVKQEKKQKDDVIKNQKSMDRFAKRTMIAANVGTGLGAITGALSSAAILTSSKLLKSNMKNLSKENKTLAQSLKEGLPQGFKNFLKSKWIYPVAVAAPIIGAVTSRWNMAGTYATGSSIRKSFNKDSTEFDKKQIKSTVANATVGAGIGAATSLVFTKGAGIATNAMDMSLLQTGISAINQAKAIKNAQKEQTKLQ